MWHGLQVSTHAQNQEWVQKEEEFVICFCAHFSITKMYSQNLKINSQNLEMYSQNCGGEGSNFARSRTERCKFVGTCVVARRSDREG